MFVQLIASGTTATTAAHDVSVLTTVAELDALIPEWSERLQTSADVPEWQHDPAVIRLALADPSRHVSPCIIVVRRNGVIQCIAPFYLERTKVSLEFSVLRLASLPVRALRLFGDRLLMFGHDDAQADIHEVFSALQRMRRAFDVVWIFTQRLDDPLWAYLQSAAAASLGFRPIVTSPHPEKLHCLLFDASFDEYAQGLRARPGYPGKTIRRFWRDKAASCAVTRVSTPEQVRVFLDDVDRVYNASWQARTYGHRVRNSEAHVAHLQQIAAIGYLRSYVLKDGETPMAFILGYQSRGRYAYAETGYDSQYSSTSPGSILTHAAIEDLFRAETPRILDFGFGDGAYKRTFGTTSYEVCTLYVVPRNRWRLVFLAQRALNAGYAFIRGLLVRTQLDTLARRIVKRQR